MNFDDNEMWQYSEIMRGFVQEYLSKLEPAVDGVLIEASVEDTDIEIPVLIPNQVGIVDIKVKASELIEGLNKIAEAAAKYNNEKVYYAIEQAIAEIKIISGLDQE